MSVFVKAVDAGSFAAAAAVLGVSAPMVGKHVRHLEDRLGVQLLHRTTRRQSLTDFGSAYYDRCKLVIAEADAADAMAADQLSEPCGRLRVSLPVLLGRRCVAPVLLRLAERHPKLELDLSFTDRTVDLMEDGFDLLVRNGHVQERAGSIVRRVAGQQMIVCGAPAYVAKHGQPLRIAELTSHSAIMYSRSGRARPWLFPQSDGDPLEIHPITRLLLDDLEAIADAAVMGMGLAWLPCWLVREKIAAGALVPVLGDQPGIVFNTYALWLQTPHLPLRIRAAVDALASELPNEMTE